MGPKPDPIGPVILETFTLAALMLWRWRVELLVFTLLVGVVELTYPNIALGLTLDATLIALVTFIPHTRRFLTRLLRAQHVKRQWTQAVIDSGAADPPPKRSRRKQSLQGARAVKVTETASGDTLIVKGHIQALLNGADHLAENLDSRWNPVERVVIYPNHQGHANRAKVILYRRDLFQDAAPIRCDLLDSEQTSVWDPLPFGMYEDGDPCRIDPVDGHVLIAGMTRSGKSVAMHTFLAQNALDPLNRVLLFDNKQTELSAWQTIADAFVGPSMRDAVRTLQGVQAVMVQRFEAQTAGRVRKASRGDETYGIFIDELAYYLGHPEKELADQFRAILLDIGQRGASAGIHIYAATQRPAANIIDTNVRAQFGTAICFRVKESETAKMVFGHSGVPAHMIDKAQKGVGYIGGEFDHTRRFRAPFLSEQDVDLIVQRAERIRTDRDLHALLPHTPSTPKAKAADIRAASVRDALQSALPSVGEGLTRGEIKASTGRPDQETYPVLKELLDDGTVVRDGGGRKGDPFRYRLLRNGVAQDVRTSARDSAEGAGS